MNLYKKIKLTPTPPILKGIIALLVMVGLLVSVAPVGAVTTTDTPIITQPQYAPGQELVMERGRAHRVFYEGGGLFRAEFVSSPEFTKSGDTWVDYVFTDYGDYYQVQHPWSSVRFYDYYTEVWDEQFSEVKIYDDRWVVEYQNKQGRWNDTGFWNVTRSFDVVSDGIKVKRTGDTDIGQRVEEYFFRDGSPCKITIEQTCDADQVIRFVWKPTGIVAETEHEITDLLGQSTDIFGLNYYDASGNFIETIRWYDELSTCNVTPVVDTHAQGRKAEITFGDFSVLAGETGTLDPETFYPDEHPENTSTDGYVRQNSVRTTWADKYNGAGSHAFPDYAGDAFIRFQCASTVDEYSYLGRALTVFDTSSIDDGATILTATYSIYGNGIQDDNSFNAYINVYSSAPASNTDVVAGDFDSFGATAYCDTAIAIGSWATGSYNDFTLNSSGIAAIDKTGVTKLGCREVTYDVGETAPPWSSGAWAWFKGYFAEQGDGYKPRLVVTYPVNPGTPINLTLEDLGGITIGASWEAGTGNTTSYLLLVDRDGYPTTANTSIYEVAYSGNLTSANLTGFDMDDNEYYFSLWGWNEIGYSENYTTASIGTIFDWLSLGFITEADMETLAETIGEFLLLGVVAGITILAFWQRHQLLYVLAGLALITYSATQWGENIYIGLLLIVLGLSSFGFAAWGPRRV